MPRTRQTLWPTHAQKLLKDQVLLATITIVRATERNAAGEGKVKKQWKNGQANQYQLRGTLTYEMTGMAFLELTVFSPAETTYMSQ